MPRCDCATLSISDTGWAEAMDAYGIGQPGDGFDNNLVCSRATVAACGRLAMAASGAPAAHVADEAAAVTAAAAAVCVCAQGGWPRGAAGVESV